MQFGQPLNAALNPFSLGQADFLGSSIMPGSGTAAPVLNLVALNNYKALLVHVHNPGGATIGYAVWAQVQTALASSTFSGAFPSQPTVAALGLSDIECIIGCQNNVGDGLIVTVQFTGTPPLNTIITVYGLTNYDVSPRRGDGRNYPLGSFNAATELIGGTSATVIAAPASNSRILLKSIYLSAGAAANTPSLNATLSGVAQSLLLNASAAASSNSNEWESGLLLDPNTGVTLSAAVASTFLGGAQYDLVPAT